MTTKHPPSRSIATQNVATQHIEFPSAEGLSLAGILSTPEDIPTIGWALFAHCFTCSKDNKAAVYVSDALSHAGFGVLRFDFTGLGGSAGDFANTNFSSNIEDLVAAADWLREHHGAPSLLVGHSLGGAAVIAAAHHIDDARSVATIAAPSDPTDIQRHFEDQKEDIERDGKAVVSLAGRPFTIKKQFLDDLDAQTQKDRIRTLNRPLMILHSPNDSTVRVRNATSIFTTATHPKSFVSLDGACHLLLKKSHAQLAGDVIAAWAKFYVP